MSLKPGTRLDSYEVTALIGAGGMGEVYRATDTKLRRDVAIKVLPEDFAQNPERLARFEREAHLLASLNHPNIAAIYGLERSADTRFLVLELVEGETLAERLTSGPIPLENTLEICRQIAEGLEAAHENGVIHRDLKPANVKITPEGKVKILDFGLAKAFEDQPAVGDVSQSPTITGDMTTAGMILGTAAYMSPEQARGNPVDRRADIWAFGVVVWEMLTGKPIFSRPTVADTLAAVLTVQPDWAELPEATPHSLRRLLRRCLQCDSRHRLRDIADARLEIEEAVTEPLSGASVAQHLSRAWWILPAAVGMGVVAAWVVWKSLVVPTGTPRTPIRLDVSMPPGVFMDADPLRPGVAMSPDGRWLVFVATEGGTRKLFKRSLEKFETTPIPGTENARFVFFSPDGRWVGFWDDSENMIEKVALAGGMPVALCEVPNGWGAVWGTNGKIVYSPGDYGGLWQVSDAGGEPGQLLAPNPEAGEATYLMPESLPDGKGVLYTIWRGGFTGASAQIGVLDLASGEAKFVLDNAASARYLPTGHLVFGRGGRAEVVPFDLERREVTGPSVPVPEPIFYDPGGVLHLAFSKTGTLAFVPGGGAPQRQLVYMDLQGDKEVVTENRRGYEYVRFSPDAQRLATTISEFGEPAIWVVDRTTGLETRLAGEGRRDLPLWSPDSQSVVFSLETDEPPASWSIFWQRTDASRPPEPLVMARAPGEWLWPSSWTPDGKTLVLGFWSAGSSRDIYYVSLDNPTDLHPFLATEADELHGLLSPDGRWIAYASNETGRRAIYVQRFPDGGERHQISAGTVRGLVGWQPDGRKIHYVSDAPGSEGGALVAMMEVEIDTTSNLRAATPRALFDVSYEGGEWYIPDWHLSANGEQFVMVTPDEEWGKATEIKVILNWFER